MKAIITILILAYTYSAAADCLQKIHLSFDDGPKITDIDSKQSSQAPTIKVLNTLKKENIKSSFFIKSDLVNTGQVELKGKDKKKYKSAATTGSKKNTERRKILKRMAAAGHKIGSHGFEHYSFLSKDPAYKGATLDSKQEKLTNINYSVDILKEFMSKPYVFRLPYGKPFPSASQKRERGETMDMLSQKFGYHLQWNTDSRDWEYEKAYSKALRSKDKISAKAIRNKFIKQTADLLCESGGVAVFHDVKFITADSLGDIIKEVKRRGGKFVGFNEIHDDLESKPDKFSKAFTSLGQSPENDIHIGTESCPPKGLEAFTKSIESIISDPYTVKIGSFTSYKNAQAAVQAQGKECLITPFTRNDGVRFHRVLCMPSRNSRQIYEQDTGDYVIDKGSFTNDSNAKEALIQAIVSGLECRTFMYLNEKGTRFTRVRCRN